MISSLDGLRSVFRCTVRFSSSRGVISSVRWNHLLQTREFSSRDKSKESSSSSGFKLDALPFSVSPEEALQKFYGWAYDEQGLNYILNQNSVRIGAAYCPVWSFDVNVRYVVIDKDGRRRFGWKPDVFAEAYASQTVIHLPGLSAYAGYHYRRALVNPIHNTSLVFLGGETVPFGKWMLRDMKLENGQKLEVFPDPWNTTRGRAFVVIKDELRAIADTGEFQVETQTEVLSSRRVYMPTYVIEYKVLGIEYQAFVSGCDAGAGVTGDSHKVFNISGKEAWDASNSFLSQAMGAARTGARVLGPRGIFVIVQLFGSIIGRLLLRLPLIGAVVGAFVGFRKVVSPFFTRRLGSAEWERQREHEAYMDDRFEHIDDFVDSGAAKRYFQSNRGRILSFLSGTNEHEQGDYNWYAEWQKWAREQWQKQQEQQRQYEYGQQQQQQAPPPRRPRPKVDKYSWDFDVNDP